jgi:hypothetical protein
LEVKGSEKALGGMEFELALQGETYVVRKNSRARKDWRVAGRRPQDYREPSGQRRMKLSRGGLQERAGKSSHGAFWKAQSPRLRQ